MVRDAALPDPANSDLFAPWELPAIALVVGDVVGPDHKARWDGAPICRVLQIAPSRSAAARRTPSARQPRAAALRLAMHRVWDIHRQVDGADTVWAQRNRAGSRVARCTVARLMRERGLRGVVRGQRRVRTTLGEETHARPAALVARCCSAPAPHRRWGAELTDVKTQRGWVSVAVVRAGFSRSGVGWQASRSLRADLARAAVELARWRRRGQHRVGLVHHTDRGVQELASRSTERLAEAGAGAAVGARGDRSDTALAASCTGLSKTERIRHRGPGRGRDDMAYATLDDGDWVKHRRRPGELGMPPPAAFAARDAAAQHPLPRAASP